VAHVAVVSNVARVRVVPVRVVPVRVLPVRVAPVPVGVPTRVRVPVAMLRVAMLRVAMLRVANVPRVPVPRVRPRPLDVANDPDAIAVPVRHVRMVAEQNVSEHELAGTDGLVGRDATELVLEAALELVTRPRRRREEPGGDSDGQGECDPARSRCADSHDVLLSSPPAPHLQTEGCAEAFGVDASAPPHGSMTVTEVRCASGACWRKAHTRRDRATRNARVTRMRVMRSSAAGTPPA
jgi:hypothetical protein